MMFASDIVDKIHDELLYICIYLNKNLALNVRLFILYISQGGVPGK